MPVTVKTPLAIETTITGTPSPAAIICSLKESKSVMKESIALANGGKSALILRMISVKDSVIKFIP